MKRSTEPCQKIPPQPEDIYAAAASTVVAWGTPQPDECRQGVCSYPGPKAYLSDPVPWDFTGYVGSSHPEDRKGFGIWGMNCFNTYEVTFIGLLPEVRNGMLITVSPTIRMWFDDQLNHEWNHEPDPPDRGGSGERAWTPTAWDQVKLFTVGAVQAMDVVWLGNGILRAEKPGWSYQTNEYLIHVRGV
jgi:hypothetical protein